MIQQFHLWVRIQGDLNQNGEEIFLPPIDHSIILIGQDTETTSYL